jgi:tRNA-binding protein
MKTSISFDQFQGLDLRIGTIVEVADFAKARKPAYQLTIDFGDLGIKTSSAQITDLYQKSELVNRQIMALVNIAPRQIADFESQCLVMGVLAETGVVLLAPESAVPNGSPVN